MWQGNQHGVVDLITDIEGLEGSRPWLFAMDGTAAGANVFEGEWAAVPTPKYWPKLLERFGKEV